MGTKNKIFEIINSLAGDEGLTGALEENDNLAQFNLNSISFVKLIVQIEKQFDIEFDDDMLDYTYLSSLSKLSEYVDSKVKS